MSISEAVKKLNKSREMVMHDMDPIIKVDFHGETYDLSLYPECKKFVMKVFQVVNKHQSRNYELYSALIKISSISEDVY
jgi:hypothetical protein